MGSDRSDRTRNTDVTRHLATQRQIDAALPNRSTWLSANAGSGKTKVLIDRVTRLLLDGTDPQNILCLTFTKAAASEMQNRLFKQLGKWAMLPEPELQQILGALGLDAALTPDDLAQARRLFALAIETPGGIKIQTIHSFCSGLLRKFPLEAGVTPQFKEIEDRAATLLRAEIVEQIAQGENAQVLQDLAGVLSGDSLDDLTASLLKSRSAFPDDIQQEDISKTLGLDPEFDEEQLSRQVFLGEEQDLLKRLVAAMNTGTVTDQKNARRLSSLSELSMRDLPLLEDVFLTGTSAKEPFSAKIGSVPTKTVRNAHPDLTAELNGLMRRLEDARPLRLALELSRRSMVLHRFAHLFLSAYSDEKSRRGVLDFDDLIFNSLALLSNRAVADWVLYKLDGGIDHILVDEAQDTSPEQWRLIEILAHEISSGAGTKSQVNRTIFVVGDKKQSIYSFQGADPAEFDRMKAEFSDRLSQAAHNLQDLEMEYSFRSGRAILSAVDATFAGRETSGFTQKEPHKAFKTELPSRVDLWPVQEKIENPPKSDWYLPVDRLKPDDPSSLLATKIVIEMKALIGTPLPGEDGKARPIKPGDFLILVRRRSAVFHELIRRCKEANLPVAGADRLKVGAELAVRDIAALLSFLATPEDDLSLATALRSPLFSWSEQDLFSLAHSRKQTFLWAELRDRAVDHSQTMDVLNDLRSAADFLRPYDMIERILTRHDGRARLLARLGPEAEDGIDALLGQAMAYERNSVDSLTGFLVWLETDELEVKRQLDEDGDLIRVMTVHGAKGLQAPIVILPDCARSQLRDREQLIIRQGLALFRPNKMATPTVLQDQEAERRAAELAERDRLLYVAMTRAEQWLIVSAAGDLDPSGADWFSMVQAGLETCGAAKHHTPLGDGLRLQNGHWPDMGTSPEDIKETTPDLEAVFKTQAPKRERGAKTLSPSDLPGQKALPGEEGLDEEVAKRRGRQIHKLLENLPSTPRTLWPDAAAEILSHDVDAATGQELSILLAETEKVLTKPGLQALFRPEALVEVPVSAELSSLAGQRIHGVIDRLVIDETGVLAVDFKTNAIVPDTPQDCPVGLLRQMGAYHEALAAIFPDHKVTTALIWTRTAELMMLPNDLVYKALRSTPLS
ncbi:MAG: double-strand break repair helicase AddA [Pseudomonadota bacterium]